MHNPISTYLREIGRVPLLTREQEIVYGKQVQQMMLLLEAKKTLAKKLRREPTEQEWASDVHKCEVQLKQALHQGQRAKHKMVTANLRLVVAIAKKYHERGLEFLDLIQEGNVGLQRGVEKFDPTQGYRFSSYVHWWITQAITRALSQKSRTIRLPTHVTEKLNKIKKAQCQLSQQLGRAPSISEVAAAVELTQEQLRQYLDWAQLPASLNLRLKDDEDTELEELLKHSGATPEELIIQSELSTDLKQLMAKLTPQQREVLSLRFGLVDGQALTLAETGFRLNICRQRVQQIEQKALNKLRQQIAPTQKFSTGLPMRQSSASLTTKIPA